MTSAQEMPTTWTLESALGESYAFAGFSQTELQRIAELIDVQEHSLHENILEEDEPDDWLHVVLQGEVAVLKRSNGGEPIPLRVLKVGEVFGEVKLFGERRSSATVKAIATSTCGRLDLKHLSPGGELSDLRDKFCILGGKLTSQRMVRVSRDVADATESELREARLRLFAGRFLLLIVTLMSANTLTVEALDWLAPSVVPRAEWLAFMIVGAGAVLMALGLRFSPFTRYELGLSLKAGLTHAWQATLVTLPLLVVLFLGKLMLSTDGGPFAGRPLFEYGAIFRDNPFNLQVYVLAVLGYLVHTPLQEFLVRAGLQYPMARLLAPSAQGINWLAIVVSNLFFAAAHSFLGIGFSLAVILPGILWGWLYAKQRSLVGPIVSHLLVGFWSMFVLGVQVAIR